MSTEAGITAPTGTAACLPLTEALFGLLSSPSVLLIAPTVQTRELRLGELRGPISITQLVSGGDRIQLGVILAFSHMLGGPEEHGILKTWLPLGGRTWTDSLSFFDFVYFQICFKDLNMIYKLFTVIIIF